MSKQTPRQQQQARPAEPRAAQAGAGDRPQSAQAGAADRPQSAQAGAADRPQSAQAGAADRPQTAQAAAAGRPQSAQLGPAGQRGRAATTGQQAEPGIQVQAGEERSQSEREQIQRATRQIQQTRQQVGQTAATGQQAAPFFQTTSFLGEDVRAASAQALNQVLVDATVVVSQIHSAHWNVRGPEFYQLHELFEDVADEIEPYLDEVAERVTALGGTARGTIQQAARQTTVPELPANLVGAQDLLEHVARTLSAFDAQLYRAMEAAESRGDLDTVDLLNEVSRKVSKGLWFVEAHLQGPWPEPQAGGWGAGQQAAQSGAQQHQ